MTPDDLDELERMTEAATPAVSAANEWSEPVPLPSELLPVEKFDYSLLPDALRPWVKDICERIQCPPDFVAVSVIAALGAVLGRKVAIRPQRRTDWYELPNLWGMLIGRPSMMKSPAMSAALAPLRRLEARAQEAYQAEAEAFKVEALAAQIQAETGKKLASERIKDAMKKGESADVSGLLSAADVQEPTLRRYTCNDPSGAALGALLIQNPNGLLLERDELVGLLRKLESDDNAEERAFYLQGADGKAGYTFDRIGRGLNLHVPAVCISMIGGAQPGRIAGIVKAAVQGSQSDDGMIQRFRLMVWPDDDGKPWKDADRRPDSQARQRAFEVFDRLDQLNPLDIGAEVDEFESVPFLRLDDDAIECFLEWRTTLENELRGKALHPAMESHLAKYRKLVPALALILHLADGGKGPIGEVAILKALAWAHYLRSHAERVYGSVTAQGAKAARAILSRIESGSLSDGFVARNVYRSQWSGLSDREEVEDALDLLVVHGWLDEATEQTGGRGRTRYFAHPSLLKGGKS